MKTIIAIVIAIVIVIVIVIAIVIAVVIVFATSVPDYIRTANNFLSF